MHRSGGLTARNVREGFRSEYIAQYVFSAFGTCVGVTQGNDTGIDLLCNLTDFDGLVITVKSSYGVQVKSEGSEFKYEGKQATRWLAGLEYPLLLCSVSKEKSSIKIYSTWNLNWFLLGLNSNNEADYPDSITFITSESNDDLPTPQNNGTIPVGKPILEFKINEIGDDETRSKYWDVMNEWLELDNKNYILRRSGVPCVLGNKKWETNKTLNESQRVWTKQYFFSPFHSQNIKILLSEAVISHGMYCKESFAGNHHDSFKEEFNVLKKYAQDFLENHLDEFGKGVFNADI